MNDRRRNMRTVLPLAALLLLAPSAVLAATLAEDSFDYGNGVELDGQSGGSGWTGAWTAVTARTQVESAGLSCCGGPTPVGAASSSALEVIGGTNDNDVVVRQLSAGTGTTFYARVLVNLETGTLEENDFIVFWFDDNATAADAHDDAPNFVLKDSGTATELMARVGIGGEASTGQTPVLGTTYLLVAKFSHTGAAYNQVDVWLNPSYNGGVEPPADGTNSSATSGNSTITHVGVRTNSLEAGDTLRFGSLLIGDSWADVVPMGVPVELQSFGIE
jgi:hypothetical protein